MLVPGGAEIGSLGPSWPLWTGPLGTGRRPMRLDGGWQWYHTDACPSCAPPLDRGLDLDVRAVAGRVDAAGTWLALAELDGSARRAAPVGASPTITRGPRRHAFLMPIF